MTNEAQSQHASLREWCFFLPWEEDEILASYIIPRVEAVARAPKRLWHEGCCYFGLGPRVDDAS